MLACHIIFSTYGFWLPNDPRGSWSNFVASWELFRFGGPATKVTTRRSLAHIPHDQAARLAAKKLLKYPPVSFSGLQAVEVIKAFQETFTVFETRVYACSILPEHVHLILRPNKLTVPQLVSQLKGQASRRLGEVRIHPFQQITRPDGTRPTPWGRGYWKVYLYAQEDVWRAIQYVKQNPIKEGKRLQQWGFVMQYG